MKKATAPRGFTLIELILVIGLFAFISTLLMTNLFSIYRFKANLQSKQVLNTEAAVLLNNTLPALIRPAVAIDYDHSKVQMLNDDGGGVQPPVSELSIFTDIAETQSVTIYRTPYESGGEGGMLRAKYSDGKDVPLHSSELTVQDFQIEFPNDPRDEGDISIQPYVRLCLKLMMWANDEPVSVTYQTAFTLRNVSPASYKISKKHE